MPKVALFLLLLGLTTARPQAPISIAFHPSPYTESTCTDPTILTNILPSSLPSSNWRDCASLHSALLPGVYTLPPTTIFLRNTTTTEKQTTTRSNTELLFLPVLQYQSCTVAVSPPIKGALMGDDDLRRILTVALNEGSRGSEVSVLGMVECDALEVYNDRKGFEWRVYDGRRE